MLTAQPYSYMDSQWATALCLVAECPLVILPRFSASTFWQSVKDHGVTFFYVLGTMPVYLYKQPENQAVERAHRVRVAVCSGIPRELHAALEARWGCPWREGYGSTESGVDLVVLPEENDSVGTGRMGRPVRGARPRWSMRRGTTSPTARSASSSSGGGHDARVLEQSSGHRREVRRRLAPHGRPRDPRRGGVLPARGTDQGHDPPHGREHRGGRGGSGAVRISGRARGGRRPGARRAPGRGGEGLRPAPARAHACDHAARGDSWLRPVPPRGLQVPRFLEYIERSPDPVGADRQTRAAARDGRPAGRAYDAVTRQWGRE